MSDDYTGDEPTPKDADRNEKNEKKDGQQEDGYYESKLSVKGQVVIPVDLRRRLGLKKGDTVVFREERSQWIVRRKPEKEQPLEKYRGAWREEATIENIDEYVNQARGEKDDE